MFFYLLVYHLAVILKLGITQRLPKYRHGEYETGDIECRFYAVAYFPGITLAQLLTIEKNCLAATKQYARRLREKPNNESRYGIKPDELWNICIKYFPANAIIYNDHNVILMLTAADHGIESGSDEAMDNIHDRRITSAEHFSSIDALDAYIPVEPYRQVVLRGYQPNAYDAMKLSMTSYDSCLLSIMCRCGKTELFKHYSYDNRDQLDHIVYVAPRLSLIADMIKRFVGMLDSYIYVELSSGQSEYSTTDKKLLNHISDNKKLMVFVCNDSFARLKPLFVINKKILLIFDETHHLATKKSDSHPLILLDKWKTDQLNIKTIFATATPIYGNYIANKDILFMNNPKYYSGLSKDVFPTTVKFNDISLAIEQKFMTKASIVIGDISDKVSNLESNFEHKTDIKHNEPMEEKIENITDRLKNLTVRCVRINNAISLFLDVSKISPRLKTLFYCSRIDNITACYNALKSMDKISKSYTVWRLDSAMSNYDKTKALNDFKECKTPCILVNCQMVTDGVNITDLDTVVYVDPKYSKTDIIQSCMRPRSYDINNPNKIAYIIIPQINEDSDDFSVSINMIKQLHLNNDPSVKKFADNCARMSKTIEKGIVVKETADDDIIINERIRHKIIELTKEALTRTTMTMPDAIKEVLSDDIPRSSTQIWQEISTRGLYKTNGLTPEASCGSACGILARQKEILTCGERPKLYYMVPKLIRHSWTMGTFIKEMQKLLIETEMQYRVHFQYDYTDEIPVNPESLYDGFTWDMLVRINVGIYETKDECKCAIYDLLDDADVKKKIYSIISPAMRIDELRKIDDKIPAYSNIKKVYGIEPKQLHKILDDNKSNDLE